MYRFIVSVVLRSIARDRLVLALAQECSGSMGPSAEPWSPGMSGPAPSAEPSAADMSPSAEPAANCTNGPLDDPSWNGGYGACCRFVEAA